MKENQPNLPRGGKLPPIVSQNGSVPVEGGVSRQPGRLHLSNLNQSCPNQIKLRQHTENNHSALPNIGGSRFQDSTLPAFGGSRFQDSTLPAFGVSRFQDSTLPAFGDSRLQDSTLPAFGGSRFQDSALPAFGGSRFQDSALPAFGGSRFQDSTLPAFGGSRFPPIAPRTNFLREPLPGIGQAPVNQKYGLQNMVSQALALRSPHDRIPDGRPSSAMSLSSDASSEEYNFSVTPPRRNDTPSDTMSMGDFYDSSDEEEEDDDEEEEIEMTSLYTPHPPLAPRPPALAPHPPNNPKPSFFRRLFRRK